MTDIEAVEFSVMMGAMPYRVAIEVNGETRFAGIAVNEHHTAEQHIPVVLREVKSLCERTIGVGEVVELEPLVRYRFKSKIMKPEGE